MPALGLRISICSNPIYNSPGLHDNPWQCDCRLFDLVQFQKSPSSALAFIDTQLRCLEPESVSGVLFLDVEIRRCQAPRVNAAVAKVRSLEGSNVLLRCGTVGVPMPELTWTRADKKAINGTGECNFSFLLLHLQ